MENVLQIHTEAVSAQFALFYEVSIRIIALLGPVERQTSYKRLTYFTSQLPFVTVVSCHLALAVFHSTLQ